MLSSNMRVPLSAITLALTLIFVATSQTQANINLAANQQSQYTILVSPDAPTSAQAAANELRHYIAKATGVHLPIMRSNDLPQTPFISVGQTAASNSAGLNPQTIPVEGFRILTADGNLYILGPDTPQGKVTPMGGTSTGTRNGVYTFLEDYLDVRWLMPGEIGEDVPQTQTLVLPNIDRTEEPGFANRRIPYIQNKHDAVKTWSSRQKLGYSLRLNHGHNWRRTVPPSLYKEHPNWFAMRDGKPVPPAGRYKLETTNPELVNFYAERAIEELTQRPEVYSYSLSPSDSGGWSDSPASRALFETDPLGNESITPLVLNFYIDIAKQVKQAVPDRGVAGYIYTNYFFPPNDGIPPLPDNLYLILAPSMNYGYQLYRPQTQKYFKQVLGAWTNATDKIGYYDLPNWLRQSIGAPNAPGLEILSLIYPELQKHNVKSVYIYGVDAWGHGALTNYVMAKLNWNPEAEPIAIAREFCDRAYGPEAGPIMLKLYQFLDEQMKTFFINNADARYTLTTAMMKSIFAAHYSDIEKLYLQAKESAQEPAHIKRLEAFEINLALLQWNLRKRGMLPSDMNSPLTMDDQQIQAVIDNKDNALLLSSDSREQGEILAADKVRVRVAGAVNNATPSKPLMLRGPSRFLLYPQGDDEIIIQPKRVAARGELIRYTVLNGLGESVTAGLLTENTPIRFFGDARQTYFLDVEAISGSYIVDVKGCPFAIKTLSRSESGDLHLLNSLTPLYFHVPENVDSFQLLMHSAAPGETVACDIVTPAGEVAASLDTSNQPAAQVQIDSSHYAAGVWAVRFKPPAVGVVDDVFLKFDESLSPWVSIDPTQPLIVEPLGQ